MATKQPANSQKVVYLSIGIVLATGFAWWNINQAMGPPAPSGTTPAPTPAPPAQPARQNETVVANETAGQPASTSEPAANDRTALNNRPALGSEVFLAPVANPFAALPQTTVPPPAAPNPAPPATTNSGTLVTGSPKLSDGWGSPGPLIVQPKSGPKANALKETGDLNRLPELAGTLLGNRPSAVFRGNSQLIVVPVGGTIEGWHVMVVHHGEVLLKSGKQTLQLGTGIAQSAENTPQTTEEPAVPPKQMVQFSNTIASGAQPETGQASAPPAAPVTQANEAALSPPAANGTENAEREAKLAAESDAAKPAAPFNPFEDAAPRADHSAVTPETKTSKVTPVHRTVIKTPEQRHSAPVTPAAPESGSSAAPNGFRGGVGFLPATLDEQGDQAASGHRVVVTSVSRASSAASHHKIRKHIRWHRHRHHHRQVFHSWRGLK